MPEEQLHSEKKVKNLLVFGILVLIVVMIFALSLVKVRIEQTISPDVSPEQIKNPIQ